MTPPVLQPDDDPVISGESRFGMLSVAGMLVLFLVFMVLEQAGVPDGIGYFLTGALLAAAFVVSGLHARTSAIADWQFSRRRAAPAILGMSLAATLITGNLFTGLPGSFFAASPAGPAWVLGPLAGLAACALLIAPFLRKSATGAPTGYFALRYGGLPAAAAAMVLVVAASLLMLASQLQAVRRAERHRLRRRSGTGNCRSRADHRFRGDSGRPARSGAHQCAGLCDRRHGAACPAGVDFHDGYQDTASAPHLWRGRARRNHSISKASLLRSACGRWRR